MDLISYINKRVQIIVSNGFTFIGLVIDADENSITLIDKTGCPVSLKENIITTIREISK